MIRVIRLSGALLILLFTSPAWGVVVAYDGFDYPNSSPLIHNRAGGFGWTEGWMDNDQDYNDVLSNDDTSLTSGAFPFSSVGDRITTSHGGEVIRSMGANFDMKQDGVALYGSLLLEKTLDNGSSGEAVEFRLISDLTSMDALRLGIGSGETIYFDSGAMTTTGEETLDVGVPYFFVFKAESSSDGDDQFFASAFAPGDVVPATEPETWDVTLSEAVNHVFNGVRLQTGNNVAGAQYDEVRIGETWDDVAVGTSFLPGDFNGSSDIDPGDLDNLVDGLFVGSTYAEGDFDLNGVVDLRDYNAFREIYLDAGFSMAASIPVPEPSGVVVMLVALLFPIQRRMRYR